MKTKVHVVGASLLLLCSIALANVVDKANAFGLRKDDAAGLWTAECSISVTGIDGQGTYFGVMVFLAPNGDRTRSEFVFSPTDRLFSELSPGVFEVQGKLTGRRLTLQGVYFLPPFPPGPQIMRCVAGIYPGTNGATAPIHYANMAISEVVN